MSFKEESDAGFFEDVSFSFCRYERKQMEISRCDAAREEEREENIAL